MAAPRLTPIGPDRVPGQSFEVARAHAASLRMRALQLLDAEVREIIGRLAQHVTLASRRLELQRIVNEYRDAGGRQRAAWDRLLRPPAIALADDAAAPFGMRGEVAIATEHAFASAAATVDATAARLRSALTVDVLREGGLALVSAVEGALLGGTGFRPHLVAEGLAQRVAAASEFDAAERSGFDSLLWRHSGHPREPRPWHIAISGIAVRVGSRFPRTTVRYPRDPEGDARDVFGCTCSAVYVRSGEAGGAAMPRAATRAVQVRQAEDAARAAIRRALRGH